MYTEIRNNYTWGPAVEPGRIARSAAICWRQSQLTAGGPPVIQSRELSSPL